jgi:purine-nucleoside phosphorylase
MNVDKTNSEKSNLPDLTKLDINGNVLEQQAKDTSDRPRRISQNKNFNHLNVNAITNSDYSYERVTEIAEWLKERTELRPKIGIVCGSGLGGMADRLTDIKSFSYDEVPHFPTSTVAGHKGNLLFGLLNKIPVVCMQGRFHAYEGYSNALCTMPMKVFKLLNVSTVILTCAAGGINRSYEVGDIMLIKDHIAPLLWTLQNPLVGHNDERFGPRFPAINKTYTKKLRDMFHAIGKEMKIELKEGVYSSLGGPCYETVSELRGLMLLGAYSVGMSTAHEALVANYCGMNVLAIALITNKAVIEYDSEYYPNHDEVLETADRRAKDIEELVIEFVRQVDPDGNESKPASK